MSDESGSRPRNKKKHKKPSRSEFEPEIFTAVSGDQEQDQSFVTLDLEETKKSSGKVHSVASRKPKPPTWDEAEGAEEFNAEAIAHLAADRLLEEPSGKQIHGNEEFSVRKTKRKRTRRNDGSGFDPEAEDAPDQSAVSAGLQGNGHFPKGILKKSLSGTEGVAVPEDPAVTKKPKVRKPRTRIKDRAEGETDATRKKEVEPETNAALQYLKAWKHSRPAWTFQKVRQVWLLRNWQNLDKMGDDDFEIFLEYALPLKGGSRDKTRQEAQKVVDDYESTETYGTAADARKRLRDRATKVVQALS